MQNLTIRYLTECQEHIPELASLWYNELSRHWFADASIDGKKQELIEHLNQTTLPLTLVAFQDNKPVGIASLRLNDGLNCDLSPWLGSLVVNPAHRRQKIGETLINEISQLAQSFGYKTIYLVALDPNITNWYSRLGWKLHSKDSLENLPVTLMSKEI